MGVTAITITVVLVVRMVGALADVGRSKRYNVEIILTGEYAAEGMTQ